VSSGMAEPELAEQLSAIGRAQASARESAVRSARWNGVDLVLRGIFLSAILGVFTGHSYAPALALAFLAFALCFLIFVIWGPSLRGTARRHWRRAKLGAMIAGLVFYVTGGVISVLQSQFGLRIVGSSPAFWISDMVLTGLPMVIVGLWEARPRRVGGSTPEVSGVG
jgi:hypothetical protein